MLLEILGPGCYKCQKLAENAHAAAKELGLDYHLQKITDVSQYARYGVMMTPALVVDGVVKCTGRIATVEEIKKMLSPS